MPVKRDEALDDCYPSVPDDEVPLTRVEFARRVGVSVWTLIRFQKDGTFRAFACDPRGGRNRHAIYLESQVAEFRTLKHRTRPSDIPHNALYTAEQAQACFKAFDEGRSARWCVVELGIHPQVVGLIRGRYVDLEQGIFIPDPAIALIRQLGLDGPETIENGGDVVDLVKKLRARVESLEDDLMKAKAPLCDACARMKAKFCGRCVARTVAAAGQKTKGAEAEAAAPSDHASEPTTTAPEARAPGVRSAAARRARPTP